MIEETLLWIAKGSRQSENKVEGAARGKQKSYNILCSSWNVQTMSYLCGHR